MSEPLSYSSLPSDRGKSNAPLVRALIVIGIIAAMVSILLPVLNWIRDGRFQQAARRCPSNLRQIGLAMQMYANDHGGQIPPTLDLLVEVPVDLLSPESFVCPFSPDHAAAGRSTAELRADLARPGHNSYVFTGLTGRFNSLTAGHVLAYDNPANHGGTANVLFGDGRVEWLDGQQTAQLLGELKADYNPPWKPN
jgi:prepilin-type processing-associated H-X9-DG protein